MSIQKPIYLNRTSAGIIKPDAVVRGLDSRIFRTIEDSGLQIVQFERVVLTPSDIARLYPHNVEKPFWDDFVGYMTCGVAIPFLVHGEDPLRILNELVGSMTRDEAESGSIRRMAIEDYFREYRLAIQNLVHSSYNQETLLKELGWFYERSG